MEKIKQETHELVNALYSLDLPTKYCLFCGEISNISFGKMLCDDCQDDNDLMKDTD
jgi:recombinational DNA repair protein RecR